MSELSNLREMLEAAMSQVVNECGLLLGSDIYINGNIAGQISRDDYFSELTRATYIVGIESQEEYPGKIYLVLDIGDAIVLSSTLLGITPGRISEKKTLAIFEADDFDAFSEIANQVTGSLNSVFQPFLPRKIHLKQIDAKKYIPLEEGQLGDDADGKLPDGEYYIIKPSVVMPDFELERFDLLIPLPLAGLLNIQERKRSKNDVLDPRSDQDEESEREASYGSQSDSASVLVLENNPAERRQFQEMLAATGINPVVVPFDSDLKNVLRRKGVKAILLGVSNADDQDLALCIKVSSLYDGGQAPIIMCSRQWTRVGVLKALKYGARDILLKPCTSDELAAKVQKYLLAA